MTDKSTDTSSTSDREIIATRVFNTPRMLMFKAWIDPAYLTHWWGPKSFTNTFHEFDLKSGGAWRFVMHGPNGANFQNESIFIEIVKPERIVFKHVSAPKFLVTATFEDLGGKTRLIWRMLFGTAAEYEKVKSHAIEGNKENLDRLKVHLPKMA